MKFLILIALQALFVTGAAADPVAQTASDVRAAFEDWAQANEVASPGLVILHNGAVVGAPLNADVPAEMASLSKAVTAICAATLIDEGVWQPETTSAQVLGFGHEDVTVAALITHSAGLTPDSTQDLTPLWVTSAVPRKRIVSEVALNRPRAGAGTFSYNNENYGVLGEMIEVALDMPYAEACAARVLTPAGVGAGAPSPVMGGMLPWGGWRMSARDYARFHYYWFGPDGAYGKGSPRSLRLELGGGADYGLGMFERDVEDHRNFWHFGLWCVQGAVNAGAYAVIWKGEWSAVATYDACVDWDAMAALDAALVKVIYGL